MTDTADLDALVRDWLTLPDVSDRLGIDVGKVRRLLQDGRIVAVRRGDPTVLSVPADFLVPVHLANPAAPTSPVGAGESQWAVLTSLRGTLTVLGDAGFDAAESIEWLFSPDEILGRTPMDALRAGSKSEVRRRAQTLV
ncbi:Rv2175c family DNA-binding protein [Cellulomonas sp. ATA003]|uniref:Rv2175c family DNA-binding protein n=1 Tax=Cellulomonas sp. ATA003 TaxID=3073064 RepID=UPI002872C0E6|nr:Rv2175c family DNA-binding protein [Cellulomonas sp. ATA003]WNB84453.1 Rv2175c family DNA-binding protein [Cellulomonas sp. ATA003]